jgi:hypothetical protein
VAQIPEIRASFPTQTTSTQGSWVSANQFIFEGTDVYGVGHLTFCNVIAGVEDATSGSYRLRDVTNNQTICEVLASAVVFPTILSLGGLSNLPAAASIFELQFQRAAGSGVQTVAVSSMNFG